MHFRFFSHDATDSGYLGQLLPLEIKNIVHLHLLVVDMVVPVEGTLTEHEDVEVEISVGVTEVGVFMVVMTSTGQETPDGVGVGEAEVDIRRVKVPLGHGEIYYPASNLSRAVSLSYQIPKSGS
jgi:hypothetical protein